MRISTPKERAVAMLGGLGNANLFIPTFRPYESIVILLYAKLVVFDRAEKLSTPSIGLYSDGDPIILRHRGVSCVHYELLESARAVAIQE